MITLFKAYINPRCYCPQFTLTCLWLLLELVRSDRLFPRRFLPLSLSKLFLLPLLSFALLCLLLTNDLL